MNSCKCVNEEECDKPGFIISLIGVFFSLFLMICPIFICFGVYLLKITQSITDIYPIKFTLLFIGIIGTITSFSFSFIKKNAIIASYEKNIKPFDIVMKFQESLKNLKSDFGLKSLMRILANIIIPGSGTFSVMCSNGYCCGSKPFIGLFIVGIYQLYTGGIFLYLIFDVVLKILNKSFHNDNCFVPSLLYRKDDENFYYECEGRYNCCYALHFIFYFFGIVVIIISDYLRIYQKHFVIVTMLILNLFTGGFGSLLFLDVFIRPDDHGVRKYTTSKFTTILVISLFLVPIYYNAVYFLFFHEVEHKELVYLFLPLYLLLNIIIGYNFYNYGYYDDFF